MRISGRDSPSANVKFRATKSPSLGGTGVSGAACCAGAGIAAQQSRTAIASIGFHLANIALILLAKITPFDLYPRRGINAANREWIRKAGHEGGIRQRHAGAVGKARVFGSHAG